MNHLRSAAALALLAATPSLAAEALKPGLWKIAVESRVADAPDWQPTPFETTQCLTEADAKSPDRLLAGFGAQGVAGCEFPSRDYAGNRLRFVLNCAGPLALRGQGEVEFSATRLDGTLDVSFADATQDGQAATMQNRVRAEYLGDCAGQGQGAGLLMPAPPGGLGLPASIPPGPPAE